MNPNKSTGIILRWDNCFAEEADVATAIVITGIRVIAPSAVGDNVEQQFSDELYAHSITELPIVIPVTRRVAKLRKMLKFHPTLASRKIVGR